MSDTTTARMLAEEVTRIYYGTEPRQYQQVARANLTNIILRVIAPRIAELEAERDKTQAINVDLFHKLGASEARTAELEAERDRLKTEKQALWGKLLLTERRRSTQANSEA